MYRSFCFPEFVTFLNDISSVSTDIDIESDSKLSQILQAVAVPVLGNVCHIFMHGLNRVQVSIVPCQFHFKVLFVVLFHCNT